MHVHTHISDTNIGYTLQEKIDAVKVYAENEKCN
jgi:hypothetical protein